MYRTRNLIALFVIFLASAAAAQQVVPDLINYQGRLMDSTGTPVNDPAKPVQFLLWDKDISNESVNNETVYMTGTSPIPLAHQHLAPGSEVVTAVGGAPVYSQPNDYTMDYVNGTITRVNGGFILDGTTVQIDYNWTSYGNLLWSEPQMVAVTNGLYNVKLGSVNPIYPTIFNGSTTYLEVAVDGSTLSPRQQLTSVVYSMLSYVSYYGINAYYLDGYDSSAFALANHTHDFSEITGTATDAQIPDNITINLAQNSTELNGQPSDAYVLAAGDTVTGDLQVNGTLRGAPDLTVGNNLSVTGGSIGLGTAPNPNYGITNNISTAPSYGAALYGSGGGVKGALSSDPSNTYGVLGFASEGVYGSAGTGASATNQYGGYFEANSSGQSFGVYGLAYGFGLNRALGVSGYASNSSTGPAYGGQFSTDSSGTGTHYGVYADGSGSNYAPVYGVYSSGANSSTGPSYGGYFASSNTGTGTHYGIFASSDQYPGYFQWSNDPSYHYVYLGSPAYGVYSLTGSSTDVDPRTGAVALGISSNYAIGIDAEGSSFGNYDAEGVSGYGQNFSSGAAYGGRFNALSYGTGTHYGSYAASSGTSSNPTYGFYGAAYNSSNGPAYGGYFSADPMGTGTHYGVYGTSDLYGVYGAWSGDPGDNFAYLATSQNGIVAHVGNSSSTDNMWAGDFISYSQGYSYGIEINATGYGANPVYGLNVESTNAGTGDAYGAYLFTGTLGGGGTSYGLYVPVGIKSWVNPDPEDPGRAIVYSTVESGENVTYFAGTAHLVNGRAVVKLPDHFRKVTSPDRPVVIELTPESLKSLGLAVISKSNAQFEVGELYNGTGNYDFDYTVKGIRLGYEDYQPIIANKDYVPFQGNLSHMDSSKITTQEFYDHQAPGLKHIFERNGTLDKSGKVNEAMFKSRGWKEVKQHAPRPAHGGR